jgi:uncharacterized membrane protein/osmotically-inducible protein OsmY
MALPLLVCALRFQPGKSKRRSRTMAHRAELLTGIGLGLGLAYALDPERGRRRRARFRDTAVSTAHRAVDAADTATRDIANRVAGTTAEVRAALRREDVDDDKLIERVRAKVGRVVSHPHAIAVTAQNGVVTLSGPILQAEMSRLVRTVEHVRGVRDVVSQLEEHKQADNVPALQGGSTPPGLQPDVWQRQWAPATRVIAGAGAFAMAAIAAQRRDAARWLIMAGGVGLLARATTNLETKRLFGIGARRRAVDLQKTITVNAPVEAVYAFWTMYDNFPRFMSRVLEVRPSSREGQSHWSVEGPAGVPVEFDAEVSAAIPNQVFAWRSVEGALVAHAGMVQFAPTADGRTRLHIRMSYNPPGGWFGHGVAKAFGVDPKSSLDADLARMKTYLETGQPPHDAAQADTQDTSVLR